MWSDGTGNRLIVLAAGSVFETEAEAQELSDTRAQYMVPFGLTPDGVVDFDVNERGEAVIDNVEVMNGPMMKARCIAGPLYDSMARRNQ